jgi:hypothetical protein
LQSRSSTNGNTAEINGPIVNAPHWLRLTRSGNTFTGEISTNGSSWTNVGTVNVTMGAIVRIGLAVTARDDAHIHWGKFDNVSTTPTGPVSGEVNSSLLAGSSEDTSILRTRAGAFGFANPAAFHASDAPPRVSSNPVSDEARQNAIVDLMATWGLARSARDSQHDVTNLLAGAAQQTTSGGKISDLTPILEPLTGLKHLAKFALRHSDKNL